jgi:hypothetical protein
MTADEAVEVDIIGFGPQSGERRFGRRILQVAETALGREAEEAGALRFALDAEKEGPDGGVGDEGRDDGERATAVPDGHRSKGRGVRSGEGGDIGIGGRGAGSGREAGHRPGRVMGAILYTSGLFLAGLNPRSAHLVRCHDERLEDEEPDLSLLAGLVLEVFIRGEEEVDVDGDAPVGGLGREARVGGGDEEKVAEVELDEDVDMAVLAQRRKIVLVCAHARQAYDKWGRADGPCSRRMR